MAPFKYFVMLNIITNNSNSNKLFVKANSTLSNAIGLVVFIVFLLLTFVLINFILSHLCFILENNHLMVSIENDYRILNNEDHLYTKNDLKRVQIGQYFDNGLRPDNDKY